MLWYSLEAPRRGVSNEYHNIFFSYRNNKKILCGYPLLSRAMSNMKKNSLGLQKLVLIAEWSCFSSGLNSRILLYLLLFHCRNLSYTITVFTVITTLK